MREDILFIVHGGYNLSTHTSLGHISPNKKDYGMKYY